MRNIWKRLSSYMNRGLRQQLFFYLVVGVLLPFTAVASVLFLKTRMEMKNQAIGNIRQRADAIAAQVDELLYVTDRFKSLGHHVVDLCFRIHRIAGTPSEQAVGEDGEILSEVRMVALDDLPAFGLSEKFVRLVRDGFPGKGSYGGEFHALYG